MRPLYLAAVVGTRLISVLSLLILAHLMKPASFGIFALVNTNALAIQMLFGSWLASLGNRILVNNSGHISPGRFAGIATALWLILAIYGTAIIAVYIIDQANSAQFCATVGLAGSLLIYELSLSVLNATGSEYRYATFALTRNCSALVASSCLVWIGADAQGALAGQGLGVLVALLSTPFMLKAWLHARPSINSLGVFTGHLRTAIAGSVTLGIYIILNAPMRNIITQIFGVIASGIWSLCGDLFYGPLNLLASAYILSKLRVMYMCNDTGLDDARDAHAKELLNFGFFLAIPYAVGGALFASSIAKLALPENQRILGSMIAPYSAVQGSLILILYCLATIALVRKRLSLLIIIAASAATLPAACVFGWGGDLQQSAGMAVGGLALCVISAMLWCIRLGVLKIDGWEIAKVVAATLALTVVSCGTRAWYGIPGGQLLSGFLGVAVFIVLAARLRVTAMLDVVPSRFHRFFSARNLSSR